MNNRLCDLREEKNISQTDLAKIINVDRSLISKWEKGTEIIPLEHLNTLCNYYETSMDYALGLSNKNEYKPANSKLNKIVIGNNIKQLRTQYKLTNRELADILNTTSSTISAYETGKNIILTAFAIELCKKYNISLDELSGRFL